MKVTGYILGILLVLLIGFHFWFKAHAKELIEDLVESTSDGKVKLKVGKLHFNYFSRNIQLDNAVFYSTDTATNSTAYRFSVEKINLRAKAILPILFRKKILIDSLNLSNPDIQVVRLRNIDKPDKKATKDVSIPEEMGKVYSSIQDALKVLQVKRFQINNGTFTLQNKIIPNQLPVKVSNLYFQIDNLQVDSSQADNKNKILFSDNVILTSHHQDIHFPDGRHRLSFSHFKINLQKKLVEFDSCTIAANRTDSSNASFDVFFDALFLTNIDFDTLYKTEVIKADSVYCVNPTFNLEVETGKRKGNKAPPKLENIIQQLTGDLRLKHVIVSNADFNIKTIRDDKPSTFTFSNNNFEMEGLNIDQEAAKPIQVQRFAMAIRNYENFIKDSSYSIRFDSILFKDDRITLSNFIFNKLENGRIQNTFSIPQFNLQGLSWDDLVFDRKLTAEQAIMFSPYINYTAPASQNKKAQNLFVSLGAVNEYMDLQYLDIREGSIDLKLKNNIRVQLENANVSVQSNSLLTSKKISAIRNSLTNLSFKKGRVAAGDLVFELTDLRYAGPNARFEAGAMHVKSEKKNIDISLHDINAGKMLVDEISGSVAADHVNWEKASINIEAGTFGGNSNNSSLIELRNVMGKNTSLRTIAGDKSITTQIDRLAFTELVRKPGIPLQLTGLNAAGKQLSVKDLQQELTVSSYELSDNSHSSFLQTHFSINTPFTNADIRIPAFSLVPHIQPMIEGNLYFDKLELDKPVIHLLSKPPTERGLGQSGPSPAVRFNGLILKQPLIEFSRQTDSGQLQLSWQGERNSANYLQLAELSLKPGAQQVKDVKFYLTDLFFSNPKGRSFNTGDGKVMADIAFINIHKEDDHVAEWDFDINALDTKDFRLDSIGRSKGNIVLNSGIIQNLSVSSSTITNIRALVAANSKFKLNLFTGHYVDSTHQLYWYNAGFDRNKNLLSLDSFSWAPASGKDAFLAKQQYQTDYITFRSGAVNMKEVNLDHYFRNNQLNIGKIDINHFYFTDFKDKQLPFNPGIIKPLPVGLLKKIPLALSIDSIQFNNATIIYTETGEKTKKPGTIPVTRMQGMIANLKNYQAGPQDSLYLQASGYLMDSAWVQLKVKQSHLDSLGGFLMTGQIGPADMRILNPALLPLASVRIESGILDTLTMRAVGREYLSWGEIRMFYHDLKVRIFKPDEEDKKRGFLSGLANLLIKNKNSSRTGDVFFIRNRDRSAINYLIKIVMSGISNSLGVKNNKKLIRRYKKEIEKNRSPLPDYE